MAAAPRIRFFHHNRNSELYIPQHRHFTYTAFTWLVDRFNTENYRFGFPEFHLESAITCFFYLLACRRFINRAAVYR